MTTTNPPDDNESLIQLIHDRYDEMSRTHQQIALYLTQNPNDVAVHSVNSIRSLGATMSLVQAICIFIGYHQQGN